MQGNRSDRWSSTDRRAIPAISDQILSISASRRFGWLDKLRPGGNYPRASGHQAPRKTPSTGGWIETSDSRLTYDRCALRLDHAGRGRQCTITILRSEPASRSAAPPGKPSAERGATDHPGVPDAAQDTRARPAAVGHAPLRPTCATAGGGHAASHRKRNGPARRTAAEVRLGGLIHDEGPFSRNEEDGFDINLEILFPSPRLLEIIWSPRPHIGVTFNTEGDTSQAYFGLSWEWEFWGNWFAGFSWGGAVHDGELLTNKIDRKELGCRLLFRESVEFGYRVAGRHGISLFLDHISNANICDANEGLENFGVRYGYRF
jgi:lipid A 3-O-deacylase